LCEIFKIEFIEGAGRDKPCPYKFETPLAPFADSARFVQTALGDL
jgi:hypothetical protein